MKNILVVAAHPDDELLGAGATLRKHVEAGGKVFALILGQGVFSRDAGTEEDLKKLQADSRRAGEVIGFSDIFFAEFPDNAFDSVPLLQIVKVVEKIFSEVKPDVVYTHHEYDLNIDHRLAFEAVLTASRPCNANAPRELYTFETLSSTEWQSKDQKQFAPNVYVNVESTFSKKIEALQHYKSEIREYPHSRSLKGVQILSEFRGLEAHLKNAEAFRLIRQIGE